jgi:hypothetical protein
VNANGSDHYLIPSQVVEAFGDSTDNDAKGRSGQAAIKHAVVSFRDF